jgi:hypothetical protein
MNDIARIGLLKVDFLGLANTAIWARPGSSGKITALK